MNTTAIQRARDIVGGTVALAEALGVSAPTVSEWIVGKRKVPLERCLVIERLTGQQITRKQLRPDIDWSMFQQQSDVPQQSAGPRGRVGIPRRQMS